MIFGLQYALVVAGYAATAFLLGNYMILYTGATELELGLIFSIQPAVILIRPVVCSLADRYQSHRTIYLYCSLCSFLCHLPFIVVPFLASAGEEEERYNQLDPTRNQLVLTKRFRFWLLVLSHFVGCIFFCCMRTLGDVLTVNYCRRTEQSYTNYRRLGPISFGMCSLVLGYINCSHTLWGLPDYVPGFILYSSCHFTLFVLFSLWPNEFFEIVSEAQLSEGYELKPLPSSREIRQHVKGKLLRLFTCCTSARATVTTTTTTATSEEKCKATCASDHQLEASMKQVTIPEHKYISSKQQARIFWFLVKNDLRIPVFMLVLVGCGIVGHSVQNFVYVYLDKICQKQHCQSGTISGYIMLGICLTETVAYSLSSHWFRFQDDKTTTSEHEPRNSSNKLAKIQLALVVLAAHYLVLAFATHQSAYYFLVEALHGFEFGLMIATGIESGDYFAQEVNLVMPELRRRRIISEQDDPNLVRVSLVATMLACFLLVYDGLGGVIGGLFYGLVVDRFGFPVAFQLNALLTLVLLLAVLMGTQMARHLRIRPRIFLFKQGNEVLPTSSNKQQEGQAKQSESNRSSK